MSKTLIHELSATEHAGGYQLLGEVITGVNGDKTLKITSVVPGSTHRHVHNLLSVTLPPEGFMELMKLVLPHAAVVPSPLDEECHH